MDRDEEAIKTSFSSAVPPAEQREYENWLDSSSTSTPHSPEMVIAWRLSRILGENPTKVIRSLRNQRGQSPDLIRRLERIVENNPTLRFVADGRVRRVALAPSTPRDRN